MPLFRKSELHALYVRVALMVAIGLGTGCRYGYEGSSDPDTAVGIGGSIGNVGATSNLDRTSSITGSGGRATQGGATTANGVAGDRGAATSGGTTTSGGAATSGGGNAPVAGAPGTSGASGTGGLCSCPIGQACVGGACIPGKIVFVTSQRTATPAFGGVSGGDQLCADLATAASLPGQYLVWLSDTHTSPAARFNRSTIPYILVNGAVLANDWADLVDGQLNVPVNVDEQGILVPFIEVWTGTLADGTESADTCRNWKSTSAADVATQGVTDLVNAGWTEIYTQFCDRSLIGLLCFEQ